jgi:hypothetical protein
MKGYSLVVSRLICFVMRCHQGWECKYDMKLTRAQEGACESLRDVLASARDGGGDDEGGSADEEDWYHYLELSGDSLEDPDNEVYEEMEESNADDTGLARSEVVAWRRLTDNPIQVCVLDLLVSLYTQLPTGNDDKFFSPILRFIVLFSLKKNGQWLPPRRITRLIAVILFCGREVMMAMMHRRLVEDPTIRYSK